MLHKRIQLGGGENVYLETYIIKDPLENNRKRPVIVVCPGGGYVSRAEREAEPIALAFNAAGFHAAVVYYSINTAYPAALENLSEAVCIIRDNAKDWNIDTDKVIVCGFSAGGHLAASLGVLWNSEEKIIRQDKKNKPNGMILSYPVITAGGYAHRGSIDVLAKGNKDIEEKVSLEKQVGKDAPPAFIWHTFSDECVPVENSLLLASALAKEKIPTELHIFPKGDHGLSLANEWVATSKAGIVPEVQQWINMAIRWVENL